MTKQTLYNKTTILINLTDDFAQFHLETWQGKLSRHEQGQIYRYVYVYFTSTFIWQLT
jgi:hypothetical protein